MLQGELILSIPRPDCHLSVKGLTNDDQPSSTSVCSATLGRSVSCEGKSGGLTGVRTVTSVAFNIRASAHGGAPIEDSGEMKSHDPTSHLGESPKA